MSEPEQPVGPDAPVERDQGPDQRRARGDSRPPRRPGAWLLSQARNVRVLRWVGQVAFVAALAGLGWYLYSNGSANLARLDISTGFDFLNQRATFPITDSDFRASQALWIAIWVGVQNTLKVAVAGIVLASVLGLIVGIGRLSSNWLVRKLSGLYVEALRNIPILVIILFFYLGVFLPLPRISEAIEIPNLLVLSNRGLAMAWVERTGDLTVFLVVLAAGTLAAIGVAFWRRRRALAIGKPGHGVLYALGIVLAAAVVGQIAGGFPLALTLPTVEEFGTTGGLRLSIAYGALVVALGTYTGSHVAEIVRASIQAVPKGQFEAAGALALTNTQRMRLVILPQALRIMVPPLANQYLNLIKNSSLAVAIAFPEVTRVVRIAIGTRAPALQMVFVLMLIYLVISLTVSLLTNLVNWRLAAKGLRR